MTLAEGAGKEWRDRGQSFLQQSKDQTCHFVASLVKWKSWICDFCGISWVTVNPTFPETNSSHLKMDGWNLEYDRFLLGWSIFGVSFCER